MTSIVEKAPGSSTLDSVKSKPEKNRAGKIKVLLVDDHTILRQGLALLLNRQPDLAVSGEAQDSASALEQIALETPDIILMDITLEEENGLELIKHIRHLHPEMLILVLSMHDEKVYGELAIRAGARGFLNKTARVQEIVQAIHRLLEGKFYLPEQLVSQILTKDVQPSTRSHNFPLDQLSPRELEVFRLIGQWKHTKQIAQELHLSVRTIEHFRDQIRKKLGVTNGAELLKLAVELGRNN